ncbi:glycosyl hydrolase [Aspergillus carlsbadensis]|nr:glycosyl hydrolase [Aspergillus carlsbadensis]
MERVQINPIVPGFSPDPSVVHVDGVYFLVNSTFHMFPGLPIYASTDLKTWTHIGNAINRKDQLDLQQSFTKLWGAPGATELFPCQGGLYAPTIRFHDGVFYIVCTNVQHKRDLPIEKSIFTNFIISTTDIWGNDWSDPVYYDFHGIDTSLFWEDGRVYLTGSKSPTEPSPHTEIFQFEIDLATGRKLTEEKLLWRGITKVFPEGPHIYKKDNWYYLLIAEGGCFADHHTIMARSRSIWGPYEENPRNPVLAKAPSSEYVQYTGHGDLFQHPANGQWYFCCLGVRKTQSKQAIMGRETFLTTAQWPEGEYPTIDPVKLDVPVPPGTNEFPQRPAVANSRCFAPAVDLLHIRNPLTGAYEYRGRHITLVASQEGLDQGDEPVTFVGKRQRQLAGVASAKLTADTVVSSTSLLQAGICYYKDEHRFSRIFLDLKSRQVIWHTLNKAKSLEHQSTLDVSGCLAAGLSAELVFGIKYTEESLEFWFALNATGTEGAERVIGKIDSLELSADEFVGPVIGIFATGEAGPRVLFEDLHVD